MDSRELEHRSVWRGMILMSLGIFQDKMAGYFLVGVWELGRESECV